MATRCLPAMLAAVWIVSAGVCVRGADYGPPNPALVSKEPPVKGNILRNSSFELGWHGIWGDTHQSHPRQRIDDRIAYHGTHSVRISADRRRPVILASQFVPIKPFHLYTVSAFVRASVPGVSVEVSARSGYVGDDKAPPYAIRCHPANPASRAEVATDFGYGRIRAHAWVGVQRQRAGSTD